MIYSPLNLREKTQQNRTGSMMLFWVGSDVTVTPCVFQFPLILKLLSPSAPPGDSDSNIWVGADARVVPADPGQTEGAGHHCARIQQHCRHARRDLSCLQDRVLKRRAGKLLATSFVEPYPTSPFLYINRSPIRSLVGPVAAYDPLQNRRGDDHSEWRRVTSVCKCVGICARVVIVAVVNIGCIHKVKGGLFS